MIQISQASSKQLNMDLTFDSACYDNDTSLDYVLVLDTDYILEIELVLGNPVCVNKPLLPENPRVVSFQHTKDRFY